MAAPMSAYLHGIFSYTVRAGAAIWNRHIFGAAASVTATAVKPESYRIYAGLVIERRPLVTNDRVLQEDLYYKLLAQLELEESHLSKHELRHKADLDLAGRRLQEDFEESEVESNMLTAVDMEDIWNDERAKFKLSSRTTEADETGNKLTHQRHLDRPVYLLVKQVFSTGSPQWVFPQVLLEGEDESTRQGCQRIVDAIAPAMTVRFIGNAPSTFYKHMYPKSCVTEERPHVGAKVFIHKTIVGHGNVEHLPEEAKSVYTEFCWVTSTEVKDLVEKNYWKSIHFLLHDQ